MDFATAPRGELVKLIYQQQERIDVLGTELARLQELLKQRGIGGNQPSNWKKPNPEFVKTNVKKTKKKKKRMGRERGFARTREKADEQIFHTVDACPDCGSSWLGKPVVWYIKQILDLPIFNYWVVDHVVCKRWCYRCKKHAVPTVDWSNLSVGKRRFGIRLTSLVGVMRDRLRLPFWQIQLYFKLLYQLAISRGELVELCHQIAHTGKPKYEARKQELLSGKVIYGDETGGREDGVNGYFWSFSNPKVHILLYKHSRAKWVVEEMVGQESEKFDGVLVTDFYAAYNTYTGFHQRCWVHLLRDIKKLREEYAGRHPPLNRWAKRIKKVYEQAKAWRGPDKSVLPGEAEQIRIAKQHEFETQLKVICQPYVSKQSPQSTLCGRIITYLPELFTFIRFPEVASDNNRAERRMRHVVVSRKISGGTRSPKGSETKSILTSLFDTWQLQGLNPLIECQTMLAAVSA